jgi:hypothetical protein
VFELRASVEGMQDVRTAGVSFFNPITASAIFNPPMFKAHVDKIAQLWVTIADVLDSYALGV